MYWRRKETLDFQKSGRNSQEGRNLCNKSSANQQRGKGSRTESRTSQIKFDSCKELCENCLLIIWTIEALDKSSSSLVGNAKKRFKRVKRNNWKKYTKKSSPKRKIVGSKLQKRSYPLELWKTTILDSQWLSEWIHAYFNWNRTKRGKYWSINIQHSY